MKGLVRRVASGERGFTLIELLVVIAILGIIAAVVVLNIGSFLDSGALEAANTEAHQVQTAVIAYMSENTGVDVTGETISSDSPGIAADYLLNPGTLKGEYDVLEDGEIEGDIYGDTDFEWAGGQWTDPTP